MKLRITVLPGDGIGPEVTKQAVNVLSAVSEVCGYEFRFEHHRIGGAAIEKDGKPLPERTLAACLEADAVLLGADNVIVRKLLGCLYFGEPCEFNENCHAHNTMRYQLDEVERVAHIAFH